MEIQGKIVQILPLQSGIGAQSQKEWKKQEYILEQGGQYPKKVCFNLWGDMIDRFMLREGEEVTVQVDLESREYNGRWYTDVRAWRVDRGLVSMQAVPQQPMMQAPMGTNPAWQPAPSVPQTNTDGESFVGSMPADDLPF